MYHIAFFIDYHPFFQNKIKAWLINHKKYQCKIIDDNQNHKSVSIKDLLEYPPENIFYYFDEPWYARYSKIWCIHGENQSQSSDDDFPNLLFTKNHSNFQLSLEYIDYLLARFTDKYKWSIIPWHHTIRFRSFVFISKEKTLRDKFIDCYNNSIKIPFIHSKKTNLLISKYSISNKFSEVISAIVFEENIKTTGKVWDACNCYSSHPLLITCNNVHEYSKFAHYSDKYQLINQNKNFHQDSDWNIYQVDDKDTFTFISESIILGMRAFWISPNTNIQKIKSILDIIEDTELSYSDLSYLEDLLNVCEWIYGFSRDATAPDNYNCSLFISRDSKIIQKIDSFRREDSYDINLSFHNYHYNLLMGF